MSFTVFGGAGAVPRTGLRRDMIENCHPAKTLIASGTPNWSAIDEAVAGLVGAKPGVFFL